VPGSAGGLLQDVSGRVPRGEEQALHVDAEDAVELLFGHVEHRLIPVRRAGVVDDDVEVAEPVERAADERGHVAVAAHIAGAEERATAGGADVPRHARPGHGVDLVDDDRRALLREALRDALAKARTRTGDDRYLVRKSHSSALNASRVIDPAHPCWNTTVFSTVNP
jgi:hypothetical protein